MSPRYERVVVVFVASPSDMEQEREKLEEVITELNRTWSKSLQLRLDLVRWETHGIPGIGADPQDVLNEELAIENADIFIGLMWGRYGTPTNRAGSGTEEEFQTALDLHHKDPSSNRIMFYFKEAPLSFDQIDVTQLSRVERFKSSIGDDGALYWKFATLMEFEQHIRMHLSRQVQYFHKQQDTSVPTSETQIRDGDSQYSADAESDDELGLLDYLEIADSNFNSLVDIANEISSDTKTVGQRINQRSAEIKSVSAQSKHPMARNQVRSIINKAAIDMTTYSARLRTRVPLFDKQLIDGTDAAGHATLIAIDMAADDKQQVTATIRRMSKLYDEVGSALDAMSGFRDSVLRLPRMTSKLNSAKRETAAVLQQIIDSMASARGMIGETVLTLSD